jgi:ribosomal protein L31
MKKYIHPKTEKTQIILNNGSTYNKNWLTFKKFIKLDTDINKHFLWNRKKPINKK